MIRRDGEMLQECHEAKMRRTVRTLTPQGDPDVGDLELPVLTNASWYAIAIGHTDSTELRCHVRDGRCLAGRVGTRRAGYW